MKTRSDYVSNSSSSSFIVISDIVPEKNKFDFHGDRVWLPSVGGNFKFGWEFKKYSDFWSKLSWCAIMLDAIAESKKDWEDFQITEDTKPWEKELAESRKKWIEKYDSMLKMLVDVCKNEFNLEIVVSHDKMEEEYAYIDHQSELFECPENARMFDSYEKLYAFLANDKSYIQGGNDNDPRYYGCCDCSECESECFDCGDES